MNKGIKLWKNAKKLIPGGNSLLSKRPERYAPDIWPTYFKKAKGCYVWDLNNQKYFEAAQMSVGAALLGYANNKINNAVKRKINIGNISTLNNPEEFILAKELLKRDKFASKVKFAKSGGEAMALAIRIARSVSKNQKIAFSGYHGWFDWYLATNLQNKNNLSKHLIKGLSTAGVDKKLKNTIFPFTYDCCDDFLKVVKKNNVGILVLEGARYSYPSKKFVNLVNQYCRKNNILLIIDEITSGFRVTNSGSYKITGFNPDIVVYGKGLGNGYAISAVLGNKKSMSRAEDLFISSSNWTEGTGYVAAIETINFVQKKKTYRHLIKLGKYIINNWKKIFKKYKIDAKFGNFEALPTFNLCYSKKNNDLILTYFCQQMLKKNIIASNSIYLSYAHNKKNFKKYFLNFDLIFGNISKMNFREIKKKLETKIRTDSFSRVT